MKTSKMKNQLTLGVGLKDEATFENFFPGKNTQLIEVLKNEYEKMVYLYGIGGEGCTHLLQACCHHAHRQRLGTAYIPLSNFADFSPDIFEGLETLHLVCVDDIHCIAGK